MTLKSLASEIAKREGKKSQAHIGDVREILGILSDIVFKDGPYLDKLLYMNGMRRAKKNKTTKGKK